MKAYEKIILTNNTTVAGNIKDFTQSYKIQFYPETKDLPSKIALYIYLDSAEKSFAKRSVYFSSTEQLRVLITDLTQAYFYFLDKRNKDIAIPREEFRNIRLDNFLFELRKKQLRKWSENEELLG